MSTQKNIFIVDDDQFLLRMYEVKFKNAGHAVSLFEGGQELLDALRKGGIAPDAILSDVVMPQMSGFEMIETIHKEKLAPKTKIIMLTNQSQDEDVDRAKALKVDGYIVKASAIPSEVFEETMKILEK